MACHQYGCAVLASLVPAACRTAHWQQHKHTCHLQICRYRVSAGSPWSTKAHLCHASQPLPLRLREVHLCLGQRSLTPGIDPPEKGSRRCHAEVLQPWVLSLLIHLPSAVW